MPLNNEKKELTEQEQSFIDSLRPASDTQGVQGHPSEGLCGNLPPSVVPPTNIRSPESPAGLKVASDSRYGIKSCSVCNRPVAIGCFCIIGVASFHGC